MNETRRHAAGSRQLRNGSQERNSDNSSLLEEHKVNLFMNSCLAQSAIYSVKLTFLCRIEFHFPGNMLTAKMPAYMLQHLSHACQVKRETGYDYTN